MLLNSCIISSVFSVLFLYYLNSFSLRFFLICGADLKRFSGERSRSKLTTFIDYPIDHLDLNRYASHCCEFDSISWKEWFLRSLWAKLTRVVRNRISLPFWLTLAPETNASYRLYAVSNHSGSVYGGHYTAYCLHPKLGSWFEFNDAR